MSTTTTTTTDPRELYESLVADLAAGGESDALSVVTVCLDAGRSLKDLARDVDERAARVAPDESNLTTNAER